MKKSIALTLISFALIGAILACNATAPQPKATADLAKIVELTETAIAVSQALTPAATSPAAATPQAPGQANPTANAQTTPAAPAVTAAPGTANAACANRARFVSETVPDGTQFSGGQQFMKNWVLQNSGACTWTPEYSLVFVSGEQMGGTSPAPIGQTVPPGGSIQLFLPQTAPNQAGEHQGSWKLRDTAGNVFGLGEDGATPFWVKINVLASAPTSASSSAPVSIAGLGAPNSTVTFAGSDAPFYLGEDDDIGFKVEKNTLVLTAFRQAGDQWRVAELGAFGDFAIEARFRTGSACSGKDSYGLLLRAPNKSDGILDSGYVVGFNCDGQYRAYRMDDGSYTGISSWASHSAIKAGPNQDNVMTAIAKGDRIQLYANGTLIYEFFDSQHPAGLWGLMIGSGGSREFQVSVSQISLWNQP